MGRKVVHLVCGLGVISSILLIVGSILPQHKTGLNVLTVPVAKIETGLTSVTFTGIQTLLKQKLRDHHVKDKDTKWFSPSNMEGTHSIDDVRLYMCAKAVRMFWPGLCDAYDAAYGMGIAIIIIMATNMLCQLIGCYLLYDYVNRKSNPKYREMAAGLVLVSSSLLFFAMLMYAFIALENLNHMTSGAADIIVSVSDMSGVTSGYIVMICAVVVQIVQGCLLLAFTQNEYGEDLYWDQKDAREAGLELTSIQGQGGRGQVGLPSQQMAGGGMVMGPPMMGGGMMVMQQPMQMQSGGMVMMSGAVPAPGAPAW